MYTENAFQKIFFTLALGALLFFNSADVVRADTITFNFNSLSDGANNSTIQNHMQSILTNNNLGAVVVTGAVGERNYNGDNHVVGNTYSGNHRSNTLGTSDGATGPLSNQRAPLAGGAHYDTFLVNNNFGSNNYDRITMTFTLPSGYVIDSISFDYEVFPNASCPGSSSTSNPNCNPIPDFSLEADDIFKFQTLATKPVGSNGNNSPLSDSEKAWQFIGVSGLVDIDDTNNVTELEFIDWPTIIGIDNLSINYYRPPPRQQESVPEPSSFLLLGAGLLVVANRLAHHAGKSPK